MPKFPPDATHPPIFIVGSPRSGTTLLRNLLRSHPRLTFPEESHFIPTYYKKYGNPKNEREACKLAEAILNLQFIRDWGLSITPSTFSGMRSYADIVDRLFEEWARSEQKPRWGDKTPHYVTQIPTLVEIFPACKIIHVIRDGRDVALSWMRFGYGPNNLYTAAKAWARFVAAGQEDGKKLPGETYLEVRYEALIQQPEKTLRQVCAFLDEDFHPDTLKPTHLPVSGTRRYTPKQVPGIQPYQTRKQRTEIFSSNVENWKRIMPSSQTEIFEAVAGDLLVSLGYDTIGKRRVILWHERFFWQAHHLFWWVVRRLKSKNKRKWLATDLRIRWVNLQAEFKDLTLSEKP